MVQSHNSCLSIHVRKVLARTYGRARFAISNRLNIARDTAVFSSWQIGVQGLVNSSRANSASLIVDLREPLSRAVFLRVVNTLKGKGQQNVVAQWIAQPEEPIKISEFRSHPRYAFNVLEKSYAFDLCVALATIYGLQPYKNKNWDETTSMVQAPTLICT